MAENDIHFRASGTSGEWLDQQGTLTNAGTRHAAAKELVGVFPGLLETELLRVRLTLAQACCVADVLNGSMFRMTYGTRLSLAYAECYDAFRLAREDAAGRPLPVPDLSSYGAKWGPEGSDPSKWEQDLLDVLDSIGPTADLALRRAIALWWATSGQEEAETVEAQVAAFAAVGLRVTA